MDSTSLSLRLSRSFVVVVVSFFFLLFFFSHRNIVLAKLTSMPSDAESLVGSLTFLNCSTDNVAEEIFWFHNDVGSTDRKLVYGYTKLYEGRFQLEKIEGAGTVAFNLVIPVVIDKDAGTYECQDGAGQGERSPPVHMIVLVGAPVCETDVRRPEGVIGPNSCGLTPEDVQLTCRVRFLGNQPPLVAWFRGNSIQPIAGRVAQSQSSDSVVVFNATIAADSSIDGTSFECRTTRSPTVQHLCTTEAVTVAGGSRTLIAVVVCLAVAVPVAFIIGCVVDRLADKRRRRKKRSADDDERENEETYPLIKSASHEAATSDIAKWEEENKRLKDELNKYERIIYRKDVAKYKKEPNFANNIETKHRSLISGITLLRNRLYVVHEKCSSIEVYDSKTFTFERDLPVENLANPLDIASSEPNECLYVADKMPSDQSNVNENDAEYFEIISKEEILPEDSNKDKSTNDVQKSKEDKLNGEENSSKILKTDPQQNDSNDQSSGIRTTDETPSDTTDHLSEEHKTGKQLTDSNKDNATYEIDQQEQLTDDEKKKLSETTTQSKDDRNEGASEEGDKNHSRKRDKKDPSSVENENIQRECQVTAEVQKDRTKDGRTDQPRRDIEINPLRARETREAEECRVVALDASGVRRNSWSVGDAECRLSVCSSNVIVCLLTKRQMIVYSSSGEELRRIGLSPSDGFHRLLHAIQVSHSYFAVSYCNAPRSGDHRLSIVDEKGEVKFTSKISSSKNESTKMSSCLIVDCNQSMLVSDAMNCTVLWCNATLNECDVLIKKEGVLEKEGFLSNANHLKNQPTRITLDEENGRLFIALNQKDEKMSENKGVSVFKVV